MVEKKCGVKEIDAHNPECFLLKIILVIEHPNVDNDLAVLIARVDLIFDPHPPMALVCALEVAGRYRVCKGKESRIVAAREAEALQVEAVLVIEHCLQSLS